MKAKEWAVKFLTQPHNHVWQAYIRELTQMIRQRGGSASAIEGVVREFEQKRRAIEKINPDVDSWGFDDALKAYLDPSYYRSYEHEASKRYVQQVALRATMEWKARRAELNKIEDPMERLILRICLLQEREERIKDAKDLVGIK